MDEQNEQFTPEAVDEQIDKLLQSRDIASPDARIVQDLYHISTEDVGSLEQVWQRLGLDTGQSFGDAVRQMNSEQGQIIGQKRMTIYERKHEMHLNSNNNAPRHQILRSFAAVAAMLVAALLVGSAILVFHNATRFNQGPGSANTNKQQQIPAQQEVKTPSGAYIGGENGVARIDIQTGKQLWKYDYPTTHLSSKRILSVSGVVYVGMSSFSEKTKSAVLAIDAQTGKLRWSHKFNSGTLDDLAITGDLLYTATTTFGQNGSKSAIYVLKVADGAQDTTYPFDGELQTLSIANNVLYIGATNGLHAFSPLNGKQLWYNAISISQKSGPGQSLSITTPRVVNGVLYTAITNVSEMGNQSIGVVAAFKASTGEKLWQSDDIQSQLFDITVANNKVFVGTMTATANGPFKGGLRAYDIQTGKLAWNTKLDGAVEWAPAVDNNLVYAPVYPSLNQQEEVAALNITDGSIKWTTHIAPGLLAPPTVVNGVVYIPSGPTGTGSIISALQAVDGGKGWTALTTITSVEALTVS